MRKTSGIKIFILAVLMMFSLIFTFILSSIKEFSFLQFWTVLVGFVFLVTFLFFKSKNDFFIRIIALNQITEVGIDPFVTNMVWFIKIDNDFSEKVKSKILKYQSKEHGWYQKEINFYLIKKFVSGEMRETEYYMKYKYETRIENMRLLQKVIGVAVTDKYLSDKELNFISKTADLLSLTPEDVKVILNIYNYITQEESEYQRLLKAKPAYSLSKSFSVLGLDASATFEEAKSAYRDLVKIFHPDKLKINHKDKEGAKQQFQVIQEAYETIKKEKG